MLFHDSSNSFAIYANIECMAVATDVMLQLGDLLAGTKMGELS